MKITAAPEKVTKPRFRKITPFPVINEFSAERESHDSGESTINAEEELIALVMEHCGHGDRLVKFCRELSVILIRRYMVENDAEELREKLCLGLMEKLNCSLHEAQSLVDLSLELIHTRIYGDYRRENMDFSYLIRMASRALQGRNENR